VKKLEDNLDQISGIIRNLTEPRFLASVHSATRALTEVKMDDKLDNKSLWKIFIQLRSPEVRKSLSYSLRLIQAMNQSNS
jgi:uncharacterized protein YjgD (DUF1641 family)